MSLKDALKISRKTFFNPTAWLGLNQIQTQTNIITRQIKGLLVRSQPKIIETFSDAMIRLNLSEEKLQRTQARYRHYTWIFLGLASATLLYGFYYFLHCHLIRGWLLLVMMATLFASQAFKYDFLVFQMKHRHLGCTLREWWSGKISDDQAGTNP